MTRSYRIKPQAKFWRRIRLADVDRYSESSGSTEVWVRGQAFPSHVPGRHAAALDAYFAESKETT